MYTDPEVLITKLVIFTPLILAAELIVNVPLISVLPPFNPVAKMVVLVVVIVGDSV